MSQRCVCVIWEHGEPHRVPRIQASGMCESKKFRRYCGASCGCKVGLEWPVMFSYHHAHSLGSEMYIKLIRNDQTIDLGSMPNWHFKDHSFTHMDSYNYSIRVGDTLQTTCVYNSLKRDTLTLFGKSSIEEMCVSGLGTLHARGTIDSFRKAFTCSEDDAVWAGELQEGEDATFIPISHPRRSATDVWKLGTETYMDANLQPPVIAKLSEAIGHAPSGSRGRAPTRKSETICLQSAWKSISLTRDKQRSLFQACAISNALGGSKVACLSVAKKKGKDELRARCVKNACPTPAVQVSNATMLFTSQSSANDAPVRKQLLFLGKLVRKSAEGSARRLISEPTFSSREAKPLKSQAKSLMEAASGIAGKCWQTNILNGSTWAGLVRAAILKPL